MNASSPFGTVQDQRDSDHLNLLSIFHYIVAGLSFCGLGFVFVHYFIFNTVMVEALAKAPSPNQFPPQFMELIKLFYAMLGFVFGAAIVLNVLSAIFLRQRKYRTFSIVVACLNCFQIPIGTTLGVFTLIVLMRESVRQSYERVALEN